MTHYRRPKYKNQKIIIDGILFDSQKEGNYYLYLVQQKKDGKIKDFKIKEKWTLIESQEGPDGYVWERPCTYTCDFVVYNNDGSKDVIDVKSPATKTDAYKIKRKLMLYIHKIRIREV